MVKKVVFGDAYETFAVTKAVQEGNLSFLNVREEGSSLIFDYTLSEEDVVYGLGENLRGINKRGGRYESFNTDNSNHSLENPIMYSSHNFLIVDGKEHFGIFFDTPSRIVFEVDYCNSKKIKVTSFSKSFNLYIITGKNSYSITRQFLRIIGKSFIPPLWAFGLGQSKWGYVCQEDFEGVINGYRQNHLPLDYVCMDIDYMDRYIDFTVDKTRFPDMAKFIKEAKERNVHLVPIIDAGIKIEKGNKVYDEGVEKGYFCKNEKGEYFEALVWPGLTHFVDFLQPKAREWFGKQYKVLTDLGFEGFWNDMNEPSIFKTQFSVGNNNQEQSEERQKTDDYKQFYHLINGKKVNHYDVHNIYGHLMTMSAGHQLKKMIKNRYLLFTRSTFIGSHRYAGLWTGDNRSEWFYLKQNLWQMPSLNICGFLFSGADTGGFFEDCTKELLLRWLGLSTFTPLMRIHSSRSASPQECYSQGDNQKFRKILALRYRLLPYIYSEYVKAALGYDLYFKPLAFVFNDKTSRAIEDQLMVGESIMIAPILDEGTSRDVYLPERMTKVKFSGQFECEMLEKGWHKIEMELDEIVFFIRDKKLVPISKGGESTADIDLKDVELLGNGKEYKQYLDDGLTKKVSKKNIRIITKD